MVEENYKRYSAHVNILTKRNKHINFSKNYNDLEEAKLWTRNKISRNKNFIFSWSIIDEDNNKKVCGAYEHHDLP